MVSGSVHQCDFSSQGLFVGFSILVTATHKEESKQNLTSFNTLDFLFPS